MVFIENILYTAEASVTGGREGRARSSDKSLEVKLSTPRELGGDGGPGTNPEQLFAVGYSASFLGTLTFAAAQQGIALPSSAFVRCKVGLGSIPTGLGIAVELQVSLPSVPTAQAQALLNRAHIVCPYSNATRGNIEVNLLLVE
jgi:lipoyl-dependent peroxiredoxin